MKKRILTIGLTILFLVSTTGLPVFYHYCEMMGKKSMTECEMCETEVIEIDESSCCAESQPQYQVKLSDSHSRCCIDNFDYKKIEDNLFQTLTANQLSINSVIIVEILSSLDLQSENKFSEQINYNLPPPKFGKELLKKIHQLKIDLPVC
jgi:hypothetical protein